MFRGALDSCQRNPPDVVPAHFGQAHLVVDEKSPTLVGPADQPVAHFLVGSFQAAGAFRVLDQGRDGDTFGGAFVRGRARHQSESHCLVDDIVFFRRRPLLCHAFSSKLHLLSGDR